MTSGWNYDRAAYGENWGLDEDSIALTDVSSETTYFAACKPNTDTKYNNVLVFVHKISATDSKSPDGTTFYYAVAFHDFVLRRDGTIDVTLTDTCAIITIKNIMMFFSAVMLCAFSAIFLQRLDRHNTFLSF